MQANMHGLFLTPSFKNKIEGKKVVTQHPVTNQSELFNGSKLNWDTITKKAYAMYMSVKK